MHSLVWLSAQLPATGSTLPFVPFGKHLSFNLCYSLLLAAFGCLHSCCKIPICSLTPTPPIPSCSSHSMFLVGQAQGQNCSSHIPQGRVSQPPPQGQQAMLCPAPSKAGNKKFYSTTDKKVMSHGENVDLVDTSLILMDAFLFTSYFLFHF